MSPIPVISELILAFHSSLMSLPVDTDPGVDDILAMSVGPLCIDV